MLGTFWKLYAGKSFGNYMLGTRDVKIHNPPVDSRLWFCYGLIVRVEEMVPEFSPGQKRWLFSIVT